MYTSKICKHLFLGTTLHPGKVSGKVNDHISHWLCSNDALFGQIHMQNWIVGLSWYNHQSRQACNISHASLCSSKSKLLFILQFFLHGPHVFNNVLLRCLLTAAENFPAVSAEVKCSMRYFAIYGYIGQCKQPFMLTKPSVLQVFFLSQSYTI